MTLIPDEPGGAIPFGPEWVTVIVTAQTSLEDGQFAEVNTCEFS
jgi:hypothetical protein